MFCSTCGKEIDNNAVVCPGCGCPTAKYHNRDISDDKSWIITLLLCFFLGGFGIHRFYVGKNGSGIAILLLTISFFGIIISAPWALIDFIVILCGNFKTADGKDLKR